MTPADLYRDACAWGKYVMFEHGTIVHVGTYGHKIEFTTELAEWMVLDVLSDDGSSDDANEVAREHVRVAEICYKEACVHYQCADAFWLLYFGTFDPYAQCSIEGNIHVSGGDMDVWAGADANPYACVELDRLFPHVVACFEVSACDATQSV
jgi:hypothetical protein